MQAALYGPGGFYRSRSPAAHFRTAPALPLFAEAIHRLCRDCSLASIVDIGAGDGALLRALHALDPELSLTGVELRERPATLPRPIGWVREIPDRLAGLVVANEWLDNVPLDLSDGLQLLAVDGTGTPLPGPDAAWLRRWWPDGPAEIGRSRDEAWAHVVDRIETGLALAIDYGHVRADRPLRTLTGYRAGREVEPVPDGSCDITAHVAVDSVLAAGSAAAGLPGILVRQRDALRALGFRGSRPPIARAAEDPAAYLRGLARAGQTGQLRDPAGFGAFWWVIQPVGIDVPAVVERITADHRDATGAGHD